VQSNTGLEYESQPIIITRGNKENPLKGEQMYQIIIRKRSVIFPFISQQLAAASDDFLHKIQTADKSQAKIRG